MHHIDFTITQSSIDNGRLYFDAAHTTFFPPDVMGGRGAQEHAASTVRIEAGGETHETDIRVSSSVRISPRKSFKRWLAAARAVEGGKARLHRIAERHYKLEYLG
ncbi:MAG: hypothetical protein ACK4Q6_05715 [Tepidimonas ignava]|uniref:hypothetical protein n=1 Tax=Tepidimonas ignava TaxID=114249 RepID=UPI00391C30FA